MNNLEHNLKMILLRFLNIIDSKEDITKNNFKVLQNIKIEKFLGAGSYKKAFLLENGNVFSVFDAGFGGWESDLTGQLEFQKFKKLQDAIYTGTASKNEPMIYDTGFLFSAKSNGKNVNFYYVEMGFVKTIRQWLNKHYINSNDFSNLLSYIHDALVEKKEEENDNIYSSFKYFLSIPFKYYKEEILQIIKSKSVSFSQYKLLMWAIFCVAKNNNITAFDLHTGNIGVLPSSIDSKLPIFVIFDF